MSKQKTYSHDGYVCPYCNHLHEPEEREHYEDSCDVFCDACDSAFHLSCHVSHSWTCKAI